MSAHPPHLRVLPSAQARQHDPMGERLEILRRALQNRVIPQLAQNRRDAATGQGRITPPSAEQVVEFARLLIEDAPDAASRAVEVLLDAGHSLETIYLEVLTPVARHLGRCWESDEADFVTVTIGVGRLQRLLREFSPAFCEDHPDVEHERRLLLAQHPKERHTLGLAMLGEFFYRAGWEILGGVGTPVADPSHLAAQEWVDIVGFSVAADAHADWLKRQIAAVRRNSRNPRVGILLGGPWVMADPSRCRALQADGMALDAAEAVELAEQWVSAGSISPHRGQQQRP